MENEQEAFTIFEDQEDYLEDIKDQISDAIKKYTLYCQMFVEPNFWKHSKDDMRRFVHYELEKSFSDSKLKTKED